MLVFSYSSGTNEMRARERQDVAEGRVGRRVVHTPPAAL